MTVRNPIDAEVFAELLSLQEATHPTLIQELVDLFFGSSKASFEKMDLDLQKGDMDSLRNIAHGMKSSAANLGASDLSRLCYQLERLESVAVPNAEVHALIEAIKAEYKLVHQALAASVQAKAA